MDVDGTDVVRLTWNDVRDQVPRVSPDGSRIVFARTVAGIDQDIWIMNADGSAERRLTSGAARDDQPVFTKDGEHVVFQRVANASTSPVLELRIVSVDSEVERVVDTGPGNARSGCLEEREAGVRRRRDGTRSVYVTDLRGGPVKRVTHVRRPSATSAHAGRHAATTSFSCVTSSAASRASTSGPCIRTAATSVA